MANNFFKAGLQAFRDCRVMWRRGERIKCALVDVGPRGWSVDLDIPDMSLIDESIRGRPQTMTGLWVFLGAADADDVRFKRVPVGELIGALVIYREFSSSDQSRNIPLVYIDTAVGLPITPIGRDVIVNWSDEDSRIFMIPTGSGRG